MDAQSLAEALKWIPASLQGAALAGLWWLFRLHGRVDGLEVKCANYEKEIERLESALNESRDKIWEKIDLVQTQITTVLQGISRLEGKLDSNIRP